ncbi:MAG: ABC transporter permease [Chloroflexota bacterium]
MGKTWTVCWQEILVNFKRRTYLLVTFGVPLLAAVIVLAVTLSQSRQDTADPSGDLPKTPTGYVDHSGLFAGPGSLAGLLISYDSEEAARLDVAAGELGAYYLIAADYLTTGVVTRYSTQFNVAAGDIGLFEAFVTASLLEDENPLVAARLQSEWVVVEHELDSTGAEVTEAVGDGMDRFWLVYAYTMVLLLSTFLSAGQLTRSVVEEKENRTVEMVLSSIRPFPLLAGKLAGQGLSGLLQVVVWLVSALLLTRVAGGQIPFLISAEISPTLGGLAILYFVTGYLLFGACAAGIGAVSTNMREGPQYATLYSLPAVLPVMFLGLIVEAPNGTMAVAFSLFPLTAPLGMIERLVVTAVPHWQIGLSLALLATSVALAIWLAARLFQVQTLLSGQLPTRRQLWQLLARG